MTANGFIKLLHGPLGEKREKIVVILEEFGDKMKDNQSQERIQRKRERLNLGLALRSFFLFCLKKGSHTAYSFL